MNDYAYMGSLITHDCVFVLVSSLHYVLIKKLTHNQVLKKTKVFNLVQVHFGHNKTKI